MCAQAYMHTHITSVKNFKYIYHLHPIHKTHIQPKNFYNYMCNLTFILTLFNVYYIGFGDMVSILSSIICSLYMCDAHLPHVNKIFNEFLTVNESQSSSSVSPGLGIAGCSKVSSGPHLSYHSFLYPIPRCEHDIFLPPVCKQWSEIQAAPTYPIVYSTIIHIPSSPLLNTLLPS